MPDPAALLPDARPDETSRKPPHWFKGAYLQLWLSILLSAVAQVLLKLAADQSVHGLWSGIAGLRSGWMWLGILAMVTSLVSWLHALRSIPLIVAFNLAGFVHVLVPLACWIFLGEAVNGLRWLGIGMVFAGVLVIARPAAEAEELL